jgi:hypothetical protein
MSGESPPCEYCEWTTDEGRLRGDFKLVCECLSRTEKDHEEIRASEQQALAKGNKRAAQEIAEIGLTVMRSIEKLRRCAEPLRKHIESCGEVQGERNAAGGGSEEEDDLYVRGEKRMREIKQELEEAFITHCQNDLMSKGEEKKTEKEDKDILCDGDHQDQRNEGEGAAGGAR